MAFGIDTSIYTTNFFCNNNCGTKFHEPQQVKIILPTSAQKLCVPVVFILSNAVAKHYITKIR